MQGFFPDCFLIVQTVRDALPLAWSMDALFVRSKFPVIREFGQGTALINERLLRCLA